MCKADRKGPSHVGVTWTVQWRLASILAATGATGGVALRVFIPKVSGVG